MELHTLKVDQLHLIQSDDKWRLDKQEEDKEIHKCLHINTPNNVVELHGHNVRHMFYCLVIVYRF